MVKYLLYRFSFLHFCKMISTLKFFVSFILLATISTISAQSVQSSLNSEDSIKGWHLRDKGKEGFAGISLEKGYTLLKSKTSTKVVVAVIDSGIDTLHEDLKNVLWINPKEIPNNGKDDDGNGYVDDIHGWNFLGNANGEEVEKASAEKPRVYHWFKKQFLNKQIDTTQFTQLEKRQYKMWQKAALEIEPTQDNIMQYEGLKNIGKKIKEWDSVIRVEQHIQEYKSEELEHFEFKSDIGKSAKLGFLNLMKALPFGSDVKNTYILDALQEEVARLKDEVEAKDIVPEDVHNTIIKDKYDDFNDKYYGNTNIMGKGSMHGTHVSGIIAADRTNNVGIKGIADNASIMVLRAVPNGDEYDKDIALSIRYAVDNGAKVINMSFGKSFSPQKQWVDEAIEYAASKDVLIVHAAGNDGKNIDSVENYPSTDFVNGARATNVITVGASSDFVITSNYIAGFSNYGKQNVDVFAPGVQIYSTLPGGNVYGFLDGTSMASPVVAGLAALIRSYYPNLSAIQTKQIIEKSVTFLDAKSICTKPGTEDTVKLSDVSKTGGIVNVYNALLAAEQFSKPIKTTPALNKKKAAVKQ